MTEKIFNPQGTPEQIEKAEQENLTEEEKKLSDEREETIEQPSQEIIESVTQNMENFKNTYKLEAEKRGLTFEQLLEKMAAQEQDGILGDPTGYRFAGDFVESVYENLIYGATELHYNNPKAYKEQGVAAFKKVIKNDPETKALLNAIIEATEKKAEGRHRGDIEKLKELL